MVKLVKLYDFALGFLLGVGALALALNEGRICAVATISAVVLRFTLGRLALKDAGQ